MPPYTKVFGAFALYGLIHSALLTGTVRKALEGGLGPRRFQGWFRAGFSIQAVVLFAALAGYAASLPDTKLWSAGAGSTICLWGLRLAALAFIARCVADFGVSRFLGFSQWRAWRTGAPLPGDGVELGELVVRGPYRWVRHPMYAGALVLIWADPRWTTNGLAFAVAASLYLWLGTLHEESRLRAYYGEAYRAYARRTPRFCPALGARGE